MKREAKSRIGYCDESIRKSARQFRDATTLGQLADIKQLITGAKQRAATAVNAEIPLLYWQIGHRVRLETLKGVRAEYGERIVESLAGALSIEFGRGFGSKNLRHMVQFSLSFKTLEIVST